VGIGKVALVGNDHGTRVATTLTKDHPDQVDRLVVTDNVPTRVVAQNVNSQTACAYWLFFVPSGVELA